ncbi:hypothetical protein JF544_01605 [Halobacillus kuroshimensis]|uniref:Uncharacterized protein n=1 Tax=Halobacillus kuroshimensis TaxID=302481 RepID=A0ABS3DRI5_9BACI|nr:hypothetical protein [Halobacillus kuroshimensis]MBN8233916.1 hypothetical protein [Halobacillus kuroshimensis]
MMGGFFVLVGVGLFLYVVFTVSYMDKKMRKQERDIEEVKSLLKVVIKEQDRRREGTYWRE